MLCYFVTFAKTYISQSCGENSEIPCLALSHLRIRVCFSHEALLLLLLKGGLKK